MRLSVILAAADNGVLGRDNALPWHLPEDLKYFKRVTLGKPVVMGRKTYESIGRPLPGRTNIVVSRNSEFNAEGVEVIASLREAIELAATIADVDGQGELMVIGGAAIYSLAIPLAQRLYITEIHDTPHGDVYLPKIEWSQWREVSREQHNNGAFDYSFVVYERAG
jgi:dihydrofolate reductase